MGLPIPDVRRGGDGEGIEHAIRSLRRGSILEIEACDAVGN
jgi:hypothetical protein